MNVSIQKGKHDEMEISHPCRVLLLVEQLEAE